MQILNKKLAFSAFANMDRSTYAELFIGFFSESEALVGFGGEKYHVYDSRTVLYNPFLDSPALLLGESIRSASWFNLKWMDS